MTSNKNELENLEAGIDSKKVGEIVVDALQEILPHVRSASTADIMMAYAVMIKSTLIGMELSSEDKDQAKDLFDRIYQQVLVDQWITTNPISAAVH